MSDEFVGEPLNGLPQRPPAGETILWQGAPQWRADARGTVVGLTRDSTSAHFVRAGLEAVAYQTRDLLDALKADGAQVQRLASALGEIPGVVAVRRC